MSFQPTPQELQTEQGDIDAFTRSLRMQGTPWALGCEALILNLWREAQLVRSERKPIALPADANGKRPRLFYFEETENCWCPAEGLEVENIISADNFLSNGEIVEIQFKREDMTDADFDAIPEG